MKIGATKSGLAGLAPAFAALMLPGSALAWGEQGHQLIGSIADQILAATDPAASANVHAALGSITLPLATTWADCVRDVQDNSGTFSYQPGEFTPKVCQTFQTPDEEARMIDYASRNWTDCVYENGGECHATYHFDDVAIEEDHYDRVFVGTSAHDIVSAIDAAIAVLQGQAPPAPISITSKREALLLLAHFVGDIHQPLHVGAIYLDPTGQMVDPDAMHLATDYCASGPETYCTVGGNHLLDGSTNLHAEWDGILSSLGTAADPTIVSEAQSVTPTAGSLGGWAASWASDTIVQAKQAYAGISYASATQAADGTNDWKLTFTDRTAYIQSREAIQRVQLEKAGARLAQLLSAVCHNGCADPPAPAGDAAKRRAPNQ